MWRLQKYWVGLVFLGIGIILLAAEMDWLPLNVGSIWNFVWPVFVIIAGGSWLLGQFNGSFSWFPLTLAGMVTAYGVMALLHELQVTTFDAVDVFVRGWPVFILALGLEMLFSGSRRRVYVARPEAPKRKRSGKSRTYTGKVIRENGSWNVRWEEVDGGDAAQADGSVGAADDGEDASDAPDPEEAIEPEWVDAEPRTDDSADRLGATVGATAGAKTAHPGRTTGFRNQTRVAGEVRIGSRPWELDPDTVFNLGAGEVEIDLSTAIIQPGENRLTIRLWAGQVTVYVPDGLAIAVESNLTAGQISLFDDDHDGLGPAVAYRSDDYADADRKVHINIEMMFGQVNVKEAR